MVKDYFLFLATMFARMNGVPLIENSMSACGRYLTIIKVEIEMSGKATIPHF